MTPAETTVLVTRCERPGSSMTRAFLLLLTNRRLVVSKESRLLHRTALHLAAQLRELSNVVWSADERLGAIELAVTVTDGLRERFWLPLTDPLRVRHVDALLSHAFRPRTPEPAGLFTAPRSARARRPGQPLAST